MTKEAFNKEEIIQLRDLLNKALRILYPDNNPRTGLFVRRIDITWRDSEPHQGPSAEAFAKEVLMNLRRAIMNALSDGREYDVRVGEVIRTDNQYRVEALVLLKEASAADIREFILPGETTDPLEGDEYPYDHTYVNPETGEITRAMVRRVTIQTESWGPVSVWRRTA